MASCGPPGEGVAVFCPWGVTAVQAHPGGLCRGLCRDLPVHPKICPSQEPSPHSQGHPVVPMGGGTAPKSLQQQWGHSMS